MGVERVDYSSEQDFQQAQQAEVAETEERYRCSIEQAEQEAEIVPCQGCGCQMYLENENPRYNFCQKCKDIINGIKFAKKEIQLEGKSTYNHIPF